MVPAITGTVAIAISVTVSTLQDRNRGVSYGLLIICARARHSHLGGFESGDETRHGHHDGRGRVLVRDPGHDRGCVDRHLGVFSQSDFLQEMVSASL